MKCGDPTTVATSSPEGKNELKRDCFACAATDKALTRGAKLSKGIKRPFEDEREMARIKADQALKKRVKHMSPAERKAWYKTEKDKRASEERCLRRVFKDPVGFFDNVNSHRKEDSEVDHWWTCKDWCEREMNLKLAATYEEAPQQ